MTSKLIDLDAARPHLVGQCVCVACSYSWVGVLPVGGKRCDLECSRCGEFRGVLIGLQEPEGGEGE